MTAQARPPTAAERQKGLEAAKNHALAVEGHVLHRLFHPRVGHHLGVDRIPVDAIIVDDPGKSDGLVLLRLHRARKRR